MKIDFWIQADARHDGSLFIREYFRAHNLISDSGASHTEDSIRSANRVEYDRFALLYSEQKSQMEDRARQNPGVPVFPAPKSKKEIAIELEAKRLLDEAVLAKLAADAEAAKLKADQASGAAPVKEPEPKLEPEKEPAPTEFVGQ